MSAAEVERDICFWESWHRYYEGERQKALAIGGPRKAAWWLGQVRQIEAKLDELRAQLGRPVRGAPLLRIVDGGRSPDGGPGAG
ncbi:MAG TPA: hypothetical protein VFA79_21850 [Myxococcales bacterium]|nr:hypothetical protein [Myxococcales bacterium]